MEKKNIQEQEPDLQHIDENELEKVAGGSSIVIDWVDDEFPEPRKCPNCGKVTGKKTCPYCLQPIPEEESNV